MLTLGDIRFSGAKVNTLCGYEKTRILNTEFCQKNLYRLSKLVIYPY